MTRLFFVIDYCSRSRIDRNAVAMHAACMHAYMHPCTPHDRTEGAFKRTRDRQPKVVLQRAGPPWLSFSHCFCERRRARGRIINAIFPLTLSPSFYLGASRSLTLHSWRDPRGRGQWRSNVRAKTEFLHYLFFALSFSFSFSLPRCQLRVAPLPRQERPRELAVSSVVILFPLFGLLFCFDYARGTTRLTSSYTRDAIMTGTRRIFINASASLHRLSTSRGSRLECLAVPAR